LVVICRYFVSFTVIWYWSLSWTTCYQITAIRSLKSHSRCSFLDVRECERVQH